MDNPNIQPSFIDNPELQGMLFSKAQIAERATKSKDNDRLRQIRKDGTERRANRQARIKSGLIATAATVAIATHPVGQKAGEVIVDTVSAAVERLDTSFNGPDNAQESEVGLPDNPNDMKVTVT